MKIASSPASYQVTLPSRARDAGRRGAALVFTLLALLPAARATSILTAGGYAFTSYVDNSNQFTLNNATATDSVTRGTSIASLPTSGFDGAADVQGTATFGLLSGFGSARSRGATDNSFFQAQPVATAVDFITVFGTGPIHFTLNYRFDASLTVPLNQPGSVGALVRAKVSFAPSGFTNNSLIITDDNFFTAGNGPAIGADGVVYVADASHGAAETITGSTSLLLDPGASFGLFGSLEVVAGVQNLNGDGHEIDTAAAGSLSYWITLDSPGAYLVSNSGATYQAPTTGTANVPETASTFWLTGLGLGSLGALARRRAAARVTV